MTDGTTTQTKLSKRQAQIKAQIEKLSQRAAIMRNLDNNYDLLWLRKEDSQDVPLTDLELRMPAIYKKESGRSHISDWSHSAEEDLGLDLDYQGPADEQRTRLLMQARDMRFKFDEKYFGRKMDAKTFERYLVSAVKNLRKYLSYPSPSDEELEKRKIPQCNWSFMRSCHSTDHEEARRALEFLEPQIEEHLTTPYVYKMRNITEWILRKLRGNKEITSEQLQEHLGEMESKNPSESLMGGAK